MKSSLSRLPNDCLYLIMKRLPLGDLFQVGLVSRQLHIVQQKVLVVVLPRVKSIRIDFRLDPSECALPIVKTDFYLLDEPHRVTLEQGDSVSVQKLSTYFPNIERLAIVAISSLDKLDISGLLSLWPNLTELSVIGFLRGLKLMQLSNSINQLKSLKRLALDLPLYQLDLSIYGQLEQLTCRLQKRNAGTIAGHVHVWSRQIIDTMTLYPNIQTMGLWVDMAFGYVDYSTWPSEVTNRITRLVHLDYSTRRTLDVICSKFGSLAYLHLSGYRPTLKLHCNALPSLSRLQHLQVLKLAIEHLPAKQPELPMLQSVERVHFLAPLDPHQLAAFGAIFPNAVQVAFTVCNFEWFGFRELLCHDKHCVNCTFIGRNYSAEEQLDKDVCFQVKSGFIEKIIIP